MQRHSVSVHGERWLLRANSQSLQVRRREGHAARRLTAGRTVKLIPPGLTGRFAAPLAAGMGGGRFPRVVGVSAEATVVELSPAGLSIEVLAGEEPLPHCSKVLPPSLPNANAEGLLLRRPDDAVAFSAASLAAFFFSARSSSAAAKAYRKKKKAKLQVAL